MFRGKTLSHTSPIPAARIAARITQLDLAGAINRSVMWVNLVERGPTPLPADIEAHILHVIASLAAFDKVLQGQRARYAERFRLPDTPNLRARHQHAPS